MNLFIRKNIFYLIFGLIIAFSILLRFYQLGSNPPSIDWDEASIGYNAYSILKTGNDEYGNKFPLSFRSFDDYKPPVYIYLTVPSVAIFGLTEFAVRLPAAIVGIFAVIGVYYLSLEIFQSWDKKKRQYIALVTAFFLAISPWHLQFSRAAFEGNIGVCFLIFSLLFFFKGLKQGRHMMLFALFFILSLYSYHSFRLINPILLIVLFILFYKQLVRQKIYLGLSILLIFLLSIPIYSSFVDTQGASSRFSMVTIFSDPELQKISADKIVLARKNGDKITEILYNRRFIFIPQAVNGYFRHLDFDFLFLHGDSGVQHHAYNMGMLYLWDFPFIITGVLYLLKKRDKRILVLISLFLLAPLPGAITTGAPHPVRAIAMIPTFQIFAAVGFVLCCFFLIRKKSFGKLFIAILGLALLGNIVYYLNSYYSQTPVKYGYFWQYGNKDAVLYAKQHENEYKSIIMSYEYDQPYIYYLFYNKIDPIWYQKNWDYNGFGKVDRFYRKIGKYEFTKISEQQLSEKNTLLIAAPNELPKDIKNVKKEILFPDGRIGYKIVAL